MGNTKIKKISLKTDKLLKTPTFFMTFDLGQEYLFNSEDWDWKTWREHTDKLNYPEELNFLFSLKSLCSPPHPPDYVNVFEKYVEGNKEILEFSGFEGVSDYAISILDCDLAEKSKLSELKINENIKSKFNPHSEDILIKSILNLAERKGIDLVIAPYFKMIDHQLENRKGKKDLLAKNFGLLKKTYQKYKSSEYPFDFVIPIQVSYEDKLSEWYLEKIEKFVSDNNIKDLYLAYGGKLGFPYRPDDIPFDIEKLQQIKERFPQTLVHMLGGGSALTAPYYLLHGADSCDSNSWSRKGGDKKVIEKLFDGEKRIGELRTKAATDKVQEVGWDSWDCDCPICYKKDPKEIKDLFSESGREPCRVHNAWQIYKSVWKLRKKIESGDKEGIESINDKLIEKLKLS